MAKQSQTVLEFIQAGKTNNAATSVEFEGFAVRSDEGNGLRFFKTGVQSTASQTPIQRGDNTFTDVNGWVYQLNSGSVVYYNGSNNWFPGLGSAGVGTYTSSPTTWNIASVSPSDPSVEWDFEYVANDSILLRSGYGNASNELDFTRASAGSYRDKTGNLATASVDEPKITSSGLQLNDQYINKNYWSQDLTKAEWGKTRGSAAISLETGPGVSELATDFIDSSDNGVHYFRQLQDYTLGDKVTIDVVAKANVKKFLFIECASSVFSDKSVHIFDIENAVVNTVQGSSDLIKVERMSNGYIKASVTRTVTTTATETQAMFFGPADSISTQSYQGVTGEKALTVFYSQETDTAKSVPYQKSEASLGSSSPEICFIKTNGNLPAAGEDFTIEIDGTFTPNNNLQTIFRVNGTGEFFYMRQDQSNVVSVIMSGFNNNPIDLTEQDNRITIVITYSELSVYLNGVFINSVTRNAALFDYSNLDMYLGSSNGSQRMTGAIKAVRIKQSALSQAKIEARGGYNE